MPKIVIMSYIMLRSVMRRLGLR